MTTGTHVTLSAPALTVKGLSRDFGPVRALDDLSFAVPHGQIAGLLGHNGAGKTTTIRILNGLLAPTSGTTEVLGLDPRVAGPEIRARTGVLTESPSLDERLSARENLEFAARLFGLAPQAIEDRATELLDQFRLADRADHRVAGFSRGMKQRLALARSLLHDPQLLFLDEPTAALDPVAARDVHALIRDFAGDESRTVVITTHNLVEAQRLCDRVIILRQGRSIADGTPREISNRLAGAGQVEIEVGRGEAERAATVARALAGGPGARVEGDLLVVDGIGRQGIPGLLAALVEAEVSVYRTSPTDPSLEDAYFALHADESGR